MVLCGVLIAVVGMAVIASGVPRIDRRFRTGYRNNARPNEQAIKLGFGVLALGTLLTVIDFVGFFTESNKPPRRMIVRPVAGTSTRELVPLDSNPAAPRRSQTEGVLRGSP